MINRLLAGLLAALVFLGAPSLSSYAAAAASIRVPEAAGPAARSAVAGSAGTVQLRLGSAVSFVAPGALAAPVRTSAALGTPLVSLPVAVAAPRVVVAAPLTPVAKARAAVVSVAESLAADAPARDGKSPAGAVAAGRERFDLSRAYADGPESGDPVPAAPVPAGPSKLPRPLWGLFFGHSLMTVLGVNFHVVAQPFLVTETLGHSAATMGLVRNTHMSSMGLVNFLPIGHLIDNTDYRVVFIATSIMRALLMAAIPLLFLSGHLYLPVLIMIVAVNPLFQSTMLVADGAAHKAFIGKDEKLNKDATAILSKWDSVAGMVMPIVAGTVIAKLVILMGVGGYAAAYGIYAGLLLAAIPLYWRMVRDARFPENDKIGPLKMAALSVKFLRGLLGAFLSPFLAALDPRNWLAAARGVREYLKHRKEPLTAEQAAKSRALRLADYLDRFKTTQGFASILRSPILSVLTGVMAVELLLIDAIPFILLPSYINDFLSQAPTSLPFSGWFAALAAGGFAVAAAARLFTKKVGKGVVYSAAGVAAAATALWLFPGMLLAQFASAGGILGLLFSIEYVGRFAASAKLESASGDALIEKWGHGRFYRMAAVSSLLYWLLWAVPQFLAPGSFWAAFGAACVVLAGVQLFHTPVGIVMAAVKRAEMDDDKLARIESAMMMVDLIAESIGALLLGLVLDKLGVNAVLLTAALALTATGVLQWMVPKWIFPDGNRPAKKTP